MKYSRYNLEIPYESKVILYNTMYKNIAEFDEAHFRHLTELKRNKMRPTTLKQHEVLDFLREKLFAVDNSVDELADFRLRYNRSLFGSGILRHTVLTNLSCNLDCPYCFENKNDVFMSLETADAYVEWLKAQLGEASKLYLTWYGGEPLLNVEVMNRITVKVLPLQDEYGFEYSAGIITNGVLLTKEFTKSADALRICGIQVTLDGDRNDHDKYRYDRYSKEGTFETILENLTYFCEKMTTDTANIDLIDKFRVKNHQF